jgi:potassium efflux system protein
MNKRIPIASSLLVLALLSTGGGAQERGVTTVPPALVTAAQLEAKLAEVEADPGLTGDAKTKRITFYRKALSNLQDVAANRTRADAFAETTGAAPEQIQRIREGLAAAKVVDLTATPDSAADTPLDQIEGQLQHEQAAADAQRGELVRQLAYQQNRPAAIRQRLTAAQEEQKAIAAALQAELAGDLSSAPDSAPDSDQVQARRWGLETRYIALSTEIQALDQELISLPMRLDLITAKRDEASANNDRIGKRVEALKELVNARREAEANQAETAAQRLVEATAGLDPALIRLHWTLSSSRRSGSPHASRRTSSAHRPPRRSVSRPMGWVNSCSNTAPHCRISRCRRAGPVRWSGRLPPSP